MRHELAGSSLNRAIEIDEPWPDTVGGQQTGGIFAPEHARVLGRWQRSGKTAGRRVRVPRRSARSGDVPKLRDTIIQRTPA